MIILMKMLPKQLVKNFMETKMLLCSIYLNLVLKMNFGLEIMSVMELKTFYLIVLMIW